MTNIFNEALVYLPRTKSYADYDHRAFEGNKKTTLPKKKENTQITRGASFVVGHKLRESKWFTHEEMKIFLAVVETGFIVEVQDEIFGVAVWTPGYGECVVEMITSEMVLMKDCLQKKARIITISKFSL